MPVTVEWYDEAQTIAFYHIENNWTIAELGEQLATHAAMEAGQPYYYIVDMTHSKVLPNGILARQKEYTQFFHLNEGMTVIVNAPRLAIVTIGILAHLGVQLHTIKFVDTIPQATQAIESYQQEQHEAFFE